MSKYAKRTTPCDFVLKPRFGSFSYAVVILGCDLFGLIGVFGGIMGYIQGGPVGGQLIILLLGLCSFAFPFVFYRGAGVAVDAEFVYQAASGKSLPPVARCDVDRIVWRSGAGTLLSKENKRLMVMNGLLSKRQAKELATYLGCTFRIYQKPPREPR